MSFSANTHYELTHFNQTGEVTTRDAFNIDLNSFLYLIFKLVWVIKNFDLSVPQFSSSHVILILVHFTPWLHSLIQLSESKQTETMGVFYYKTFQLLFPNVCKEISTTQSLFSYAEDLL